MNDRPNAAKARRLERNRSKTQAIADLTNAVRNLTKALTKVEDATKSQPQPHICEVKDISAPATSWWVCPTCKQMWLRVGLAPNISWTPRTFIEGFEDLQCVCGNPKFPGVIHRHNDPCYWPDKPYATTSTQYVDVDPSPHPKSNSRLCSCSVVVFPDAGDNNFKKIVNGTMHRTDGPCYKIPHPHVCDIQNWQGTPGDTKMCIVCQKLWLCKEFGELDIKWVPASAPHCLCEAGVTHSGCLIHGTLAQAKKPIPLCKCTSVKVEGETIAWDRSQCELHKGTLVHKATFDNG